MSDENQSKGISWNEAYQIAHQKNLEYDKKSLYADLHKWCEEIREEEKRKRVARRKKVSKPKGHFLHKIDKSDPISYHENQIDSTLLKYDKRAGILEYSRIRFDKFIFRKLFQDEFKKSKKLRSITKQHEYDKKYQVAVT
jgi:hypothetical protein